MNFDATFPLKLYINLRKHDQRRRQTENELLDAEIEDYERISAFPGKWVTSVRGYPSANRYAQALSHKKAVWTGWKRKAPAVLVFEDDVILARHFKQKLGDIELPEDWAVFFFGCQHRLRPTIAKLGVVRCVSIWDMHAYAVRASAYSEVMRSLTPFGKATSGVTKGDLHSCDEQVNKLCARIPVYAAWPNLAWQRHSISEAQQNWVNDSYTAEGHQTTFPEAVDGLSDEMEQHFCTRRSIQIMTEGGSPHSERFLFCRTNQDLGLGDRLRGLASLRLLAKLAGRTACIWWDVHTLNLQGQHEDILEPAGYRAISDEAEWRRLTFMEDVYRTQSNLMPEVAIELARQRGLTGRYSHEELIALWHRLARECRASRMVNTRVSAAVEGWKACRPLGLHIRRTDALADPNRSVNLHNVQENDALTQQRLLEVIRERGFDSVFLACDNPDTERVWRIWLENQGIRILRTNRAWRAGHFRRTSLEDTAVDLFLLSRCDYILAAVWSSFSWMASVIGDVSYDAVGLKH